MTECNKCGACCRYIYTNAPRDRTSSMMQFWKEHGAVIGAKYMLLPLPCFNLLLNNTCFDYANRSQFCRDFPKDTPQEVLKLLGCIFYKR